MKKLILLILIVVFSGCATKTVYVDKPVEVLIPIEKPLVPPKRYIKGNNRAETLLNILKYKDTLEVVVGTRK